MPKDAVADSIAIPSGGDDIAQPPPNVGWSIRRVFAPNNVETSVTDGNDAQIVRSGEVSDDIPITNNIHVKFDNNSCIARTVFYHAVEL